MSDDYRQWFTAGEIAEIATRAGSAGEVPKTKSGMIRWIKRRSIADPEFAENLRRLSRKRAGRKGGGGTEYHCSLFNGALATLLSQKARSAMVTDMISESRYPRNRRADEYAGLPNVTHFEREYSRARRYLECCSDISFEKLIVELEDRIIPLLVRRGYNMQRDSEGS